MHIILRELATPGNPPVYPIIDSNEDILSKSLTYYSNYIQSKFTASYSIDCNIINCYKVVIIQISRCCYRCHL